MAKVMLRSFVNRRFYYSYASEPFQPLPRTPVRMTAEEAIRIVKSGELNYTIIFLLLKCN